MLSSGAVPKGLSSGSRVGPRVRPCMGLPTSRGKVLLVVSLQAVPRPHQHDTSDPFYSLQRKIKITYMFI